MANIMRIIGIMFIAWTGWSIYAEYTYAWDVVERSYNPVMYWLLVVFWGILGLNFFYIWAGKYK